MTADRLTRRIRRIARSPYAVTGASIAGAALGNVVCYKIVAVLGTAGTFSEYSTARRYITFALPFALLGAGVALPLRCSRHPDEDESRRILYAQFSTAAVIVASALALVWFGPPSVSDQMPGLSRSGLVAVLVMVFAFNCTSMLYAYHRGFRDFRKGAVLVVLANGVFPSVGALFAAAGPEQAIWVWACLSLVLAAIAVCRLGWPGFGPITDRGALLRSSLGRMPGDLAYAAVFLVPVAQMQVLGDPARESVFNYFFVLLGAITAAAAPVSAVLLPVVGSRVAQGGRRAARGILVFSIAFGTAIGIAVWLVLDLASRTLIGLFMSVGYVDQAHVLSSLGPASVGLALYVSVKSVLDGAGETPLTAAISVLALAVYFLARSLVGGATEPSVIVATNWAMGFLGLGTVACSLVVFVRGGGAGQRSSRTGAYA